MRTRRRRRRILRFFWRAMVGVLVWDVLLPRIGLRNLSQLTRRRRMQRIAVRFRTLAVRMGGVLIKVGQFLSSRLDVLPREITGELALLQDEVGAERFDDIRAIVEAELGEPLERRFAEFDPVPVASASIGQVHNARLTPGTAPGSSPERVVVKVQRPRIRQIVDDDLAALRVVGGWLARFPAVSRRANVPALIEEFSRTVYEELDYVHEGRNAERFAGNFSSRRDVLVPRVIWSHTTRRVLTLEDVGAIKITDYEGIERAGIDRRSVARRLFDTYLQQIFGDGFFHADPHPGNLFVLPASTPGHPDAWRLVFVDFGMTGTLAPEAFAGLREALVAVATRDAAALIGAYRKLKLLLPGADVELIERASRRVLEQMWGRSTRDIQAVSAEEIRAFFQEFSQLLYEMPFQVPENLIMLGRCVSILAGMASGLDPDFNLWDGIAPYARKLVAADGGRRSRLVFERIAADFRALTAMPRRVDSLLARLEEGRLEVRTPDLRQLLLRLERGMRKLGLAVIFAALLLSGTLLFLGGREWEAIVFVAACALILTWLAFGR